MPRGALSEVNEKNNPLNSSFGTYLSDMSSLKGILIIMFIGLSLLLSLNFFSLDLFSIYNSYSD
jgi:hypothetical protein